MSFRITAEAEGVGITTYEPTAEEAEAMRRELERIGYTEIKVEDENPGPYLRLIQGGGA